MKKIITLFVLLAIGTAAFAGVKDPVTWSFAAKKRAENTYEVVITATVAKPWHIYSITSPKGAGMPTEILFKKNPLISLLGPIKENGKLQSEYNKDFDATIKYYADKVEFVQMIVLKGKAKTNISGTVEYMVCNDDRCLPPAKKTFEIKLP
jgi:hypothetical protein